MKRNSFTLIELLVVIAVIGLLSSVVLIGLNNARGKANDTKRKTEAEQITKALAIYYFDHDKYPILPTFGSLEQADTLIVNAGLPDEGFFEDIMAPYLTSIPTDPRFGEFKADNQEKTYLAAIPIDPLWGQDKDNDSQRPFSYKYRTDEEGSSYIIHFELESSDDYYEMYGGEGGGGSSYQGSPGAPTINLVEDDGPVIVGFNITFSANWSDDLGDYVKTYICASDQGITNQDCVGNTYCKSNWNNFSPNQCSYTTVTNNTFTYYAYACDDDSSCSDPASGQFTVTCPPTQCETNCIAQTTNWGENLHDCNGADKRCYNGECKTCDGTILQGASGDDYCYYAGPTGNVACSTVCNGRGSCASGNWDDSYNPIIALSCLISKTMTGCYGCGGTGQGWAPGRMFDGTCQRKDGTPSCTATTGHPDTRRVCACNY